MFVDISFSSFLFSLVNNLLILSTCVLESLKSGSFSFLLLYENAQSNNKSVINIENNILGVDNTFCHIPNPLITYTTLPTT